MSSNAFLLVGKERLLKKEFIRQLQKKSFQNSSDASLNTQEWDITETGTLEGVLDFIQTAPFLAEKRIAVLWNVEDLEDESRERLLASLKKLPATSLVVMVSEETGTKKNAFLRELEEGASLIPCHAPFEKDLPGWIEQTARKMGISLDRDASRNLLDKAGKEISTLHNALETLAIYAHPRLVITSQDIDRLLVKTSEEDIFAIAEDLFQKNSRGALEKTSRLFVEGVRAQEVIGVLAGQLERMKQASDLLERGASPVEVASALRVHSFFQQKFFLQLKKLTRDSVSRMQKRLLECDLSIKEGRLTDRLALEKFILES